MSSTFPVTAETLSGIDVLSELAHETRADVARACCGRIYEASQELAVANEDAREVFFIVSGEVKVALHSRTGREVVFRTMKAGTMFGELAAIDDEPRSASVYATTTTFAASLSRDQFRRFVETYPDMATGVMRHLSRLVRSLSQRVFEHDALKVGSRIHAELLRMAQVSGSSGNVSVISPAPTDEALARMVGTNRAAVNRELASLRYAGLIAKRAGRLRVLDVAGLQHLVLNYQDRYRSTAGG